MLSRPLHPFLIAVFPPLSLFAANAEEVSWSAVVAPVGVCLALATAAVAGCRAARRTWQEAALLASYALVLFFALGRVHAELMAIEQLRGAATWLGAAEVVGGAAMLVGGFRAAAPASLAEATRALNLFGVGVVAAALFSAGGQHLAERPPQHRLPPVDLQARADPPHIFYVVLDGYGREDVLAELYGFDNHPFVRALEERRFFVASAAYANYSQTALSLASSLNMAYLEELGGTEVDRSSREPLTAMINSSRVAEALRSVGYEFVAFSTGYSVAEPITADRFLAPPWTASEFTSTFLSLTPLRAVLAWLGQAPAQVHLRRIRYTLDALPGLAAESGPLFVLAHVIAPHPPFLLGQSQDSSAMKAPFSTFDGDLWRNLHGAPPEAYRREYTGQLEALNTLVLHSISGILSSGRPAIVVVQGDHGPGSELTFGSARATNLRERLAILNAIHLPDGDYGGVGPALSPVNTFRYVLGRYFGAELPLLEDHAHFSTWAEPYQFIRFVDRLPAAAGQPSEGDGRF